MIQIDKVAHFLGGYFCATILPVLPVDGLLLATIAGLVKEAHDSRGHGVVEKADFWLTVAGGAVGAAAMYIKTV